MATVHREYLQNMLTRWASGTVSPAEVLREARARWVAGAAPPEDSIASDVLLMLATASASHEDIPALLEFLATPTDVEPVGRDRLYDYFGSIDWKQREASLAGAHGLAATDQEEDAEFYLPTLDQRRLHRAIRLDPESVWDEVRAALCAAQSFEGRGGEPFLTDLIEDLVYGQCTQFIDRLEQLAEECPPARERLSMAYVGGIASSPALERFWNMQETLSREDSAATR